MPFTKLVSCNGETIEVETEIVKQFRLISTMMKNLGTDDKEEEPVFLSEVHGATLRKIIEWCTYHKDDPEVNGNNTVTHSDEVCSWDEEFFNVDNRTLFRLFHAANFMHIGGLLHVMCNKVAKMIKDKSPEEIRKSLNIQNDLSLEEEKVVREEYRFEDEQ